MKDLSLALVILFSTKAFSSAEYSGKSDLGFSYFSFQDFRNKIVQTNASTVAAGLQCLPQEFGNNLTFIRAGGALQESSPEFPRVISFGDTAHLIATFNGHAKQAGFDSIETAEFDEKLQRILFRAIVFKKESQKTESFATNEIEFENKNILVTKANPGVCVACHGLGEKNSQLSRVQLMRYLWTPYPKWPSAFGENDDAETPDFAAKKLEWSKNLRYRNLIADQDHLKGAFPYYFLSKKLAKKTENDPARKLNRMPNTRLTTLMALNYSRQMADLVNSNAELTSLLKTDVANYCKGQMDKDGMALQLGFAQENKALGLPKNYMRMDRDVSEQAPPFLANDESTSQLGFVIAAGINKTGSIGFLNPLLDKIVGTKKMGGLDDFGLFISGLPERTKRLQFIQLVNNSGEHSVLNNPTRSEFQLLICGEKQP